MRYFLKMVSQDFWKHFIDSGRRTVGSAKSREPKRGDVFICYLTGASAWSGVLELTGSVLSSDDPSLAVADRWHEEFPLQFPVEPKIVLPQEQAISVRDPYVWSSLDHTRNGPMKSRWNGRFRTDLQKLTAGDGAFLTRILAARHLGIPIPSEGDSDTWDPQGVVDTRDRNNRAIVVRRGQQEFRNALLEAYDGSCAVTGCRVRDVLEAAHITPYLGDETNHITNGLLLRSDIHTLFDCGLIAIDPTKLTVIIHPSLRDSEYRSLHGQALRPRHGEKHPNRHALRKHVDRWLFPIDWQTE